VEEWKARSPIKRFREYLLAGGLADEDDLAGIDAEVKEIVEDALQFATASPWPEPASALDHVYST
jgi:TPP-dependent pyruvate/acetoin dehydrogenase alpha subunit